VIPYRASSDAESCIRETEVTSWHGIVLSLLLKNAYFSVKVGFLFMKLRQGHASRTVTYIYEPGYLPFPGIGAYFSKKSAET
jgi:hypothetical protein